MEQNIKYMLKQLDKQKTERDKQLGLFNWIRSGVITFEEYQEIVKYLFIPVVVGQSEQFNCFGGNHAKGIKPCSEHCGEDICLKPSN